ncbi:MAG: glycosyltransferase, partial [Alphaproteobacteria bacterium]|nr:glycosyltransferase [Alphaproteobacteria bacterium]
AGHDARLTIIGDGPLRERLEQTKDALGLGDRVAFLGWRKQDYIARAMREADILLAPSVTTESGDQEGIPVTIMEAMACGMIVLSTWHSGIPELVEHGKTGLLVKERDREGITRTLIDLAEASPEQWRRYSQAARLKVEADFDIASLNLELERKLRRMALTAPVA